MKTNIKNLYHRQDGRWEFSKVINGKRTYIIASTREKALNKIKEIKDELKAQKLSGGKETVVGWARFWLKTYKKNVYSTENYNYVIEKYMAPYFKNMPLKKLQPMQIQLFLNTMVSKPRMMDYAYMTMNQMLKQAYINNKISRNLVGVIVKPKSSIKKKRKTALSLSEQEKFLKVLKTYDQDTQMFMLFSIICGTRRTETCKFELADIDAENCKIHVKGTKTD